MIQSILPLLAKGYTVQFTFESVGDNSPDVDFTVIATSEGKLPNIVPRSFRAPAAELDAEMPQLLAELTQTNVSLAQQLQDAKLVAEAAAKEASQKAAEKPKPIKKTVPKSTVPSGLKGEEDGEDGDDSGLDADPEAQGAQVEQTPPKSVAASDKPDVADTMALFL